MAVELADGRRVRCELCSRGDGYERRAQGGREVVGACAKVGFLARLRVVEKVHRTPGQAGWLLARRPVGSGPGAEVKCYLSNAPATIALAELAAVGCLRWTIEEDFELAKGEVGLDHYEVRKFRGRYHHITLSLLALAFLKAVQREWGNKQSPSVRAEDPSAA